jgi:hypothetical protein
MSDVTHPMTEAEAQSAFSSLSVDLERLCEQAKGLVSGLGHEWPDAFYNDEQTSLLYWLCCGADALHTDLESCLSVARRAATITEEEIHAARAARVASGSVRG